MVLGVELVGGCDIDVGREGFGGGRGGLLGLKEVGM